jgi:acyl-CoA synthetase (AMP-forming)/AMP-acid ligase II
MSTYDSLNPVELFASIPGDRTAIIIPESGFRLTYASLLQQVHDLKRSGTPNAVSLIAQYLSESSVVLFTSGRNGRAKAVRLSWASLNRSARNVARSLALGPDDVSLCVMPLTHVHGLIASTLAVFATGGTVVIPGAFHPLSFWRIARDHRVTWYTATPQIHQMLLARTAAPGSRKPAGAAHLRLIRSAGAPLWRQVVATLELAFEAPVIDAYEVTEASGQVASSPLPPAERSPGSVGRPNGVEVEIVDADRKRLSLGEHGEIVLRGRTVAASYENDPAATARSFVDGWFHTGDLGYLDAHGVLTLTGDRVSGAGFGVRA